ncbi:hypothetical protein EMCRGX_G030353 [Ephydatia muelleri]
MEGQRRNGSLISASVRDSYKADPEKKKASVRDSYKADPEKKKASVRDRYKADPEKKKASVRDSYNADIESKQSAKRQRYQEDVEEYSTHNLTSLSALILRGKDSVEAERISRDMYLLVPTEPGSKDPLQLLLQTTTPIEDGQTHVSDVHSSDWLYEIVAPVHHAKSALAQDNVRDVYRPGNCAGDNVGFP